MSKVRFLGLDVHAESECDVGSCGSERCFCEAWNHARAAECDRPEYQSSEIHLRSKLNDSRCDPLDAATDRAKRGWPTGCFDRSAVPCNENAVD